MCKETINHTKECRTRSEYVRRLSLIRTLSVAPTAESNETQTPWEYEQKKVGRTDGYAPPDKQMFRTETTKNKTKKEIQKVDEPTRLNSGRKEV